ncbi:MAG: hypothetical protein Q4F05_19555, partial [bacterium]|nr:hypothetical protein [bacterium]
MRKKFLNRILPTAVATVMVCNLATVPMPVAEASTNKAAASYHSANTAVTQSEAGTYAHNFTADGLVSNYFTITGNIASDKGSASYNDLEFTKCLKVESSTSLSFTTSNDQATLLILSKSKATGGKLKVNGTVCDDFTNLGTTAAVYTTTLGDAGTYTITKGTNENYIYYVAVYDGEGTPDVTTAPTATASPSAEPSTAPSVSPTLHPTTAPTIDVPIINEANALYVAANGTGTGTKENPADLETALTTVAAGQTIYLLGGTYSYDHQITIAESNSGTANAYKTICAYPGETVVLDFSAQVYGDTASNPRGIQQEGSYWHWKDITITGASDNGMLLAGDYNVIERCVFDGNRDTGLQISRANTSYSDIKDWPSYNLILNCTSCNNMDTKTGENA